MIKKLKIRILVVFIALLLLVPAGYFVVRSEYEKKVALAQENSENIIEIANEYQKYKNEYLQAVKEEKESNRRKMKETEMAYKFLLEEQDKIIEEHTRQVAVSDGEAPSGSSSGSSSLNNVQTNTTTTTRTVKKPVSTRTTRAS
jgi:hypothetical protein